MRSHARRALPAKLHASELARAGSRSGRQQASTSELNPREGSTMQTREPWPARLRASQQCAGGPGREVDRGAGQHLVHEVPALSSSSGSRRQCARSDGFGRSSSGRRGPLLLHALHVLRSGLVPKAAPWLAALGLRRARGRSGLLRVQGVLHENGHGSPRQPLRGSEAPGSLADWTSAGGAEARGRVHRDDGPAGRIERWIHRRHQRQTRGLGAGKQPLGLS